MLWVLLGAENSRAVPEDEGDKEESAIAKCGAELLFEAVVINLHRETSGTKGGGL